jgi:hypothetical protein
MRRARLARALRWAAALPLLLATPPAALERADPRGAGATVRVVPSEIHVGMLFRGTRVHVEGTAPAHGQVALVCVGREGKVELKKKGKVGGLLWMNVGDVAFERVPTLFLASSEPSAHAGATKALGYAGLEARALPAGADEDARELFREFIRLKERERLYFAGNGPVRASPTEVSVDFWLPASVPPGEYEVKMLGYEEDAVEVLATEKLTVRSVGLAALISSTARRHGLVYGILSVVLAIAVGFLTGMMFKASKKGH